MGYDTAKLLTSNFLDGNDVEPFLNVTIHSLTQEEFKQRDGSTRIATIVWFKEVEKGLKTNNGMLRTLIQLLGKGDTDAWIDKKVQLYPVTTEYGGEEYYVARVRAVRDVPSQNANQSNGNDPKQVWGRFYLSLSADDRKKATTILGGGPAAWMAKTGKTVVDAINFVKGGLLVVEPAQSEPVDDIPF